MVEGGDPVWINGHYDSVNYEYALLPYWVGEDASYIETPNISEATKIVYEVYLQSDQIDHSAIPTADPDTVISKWANGPLVKHHIEDCPWKFSGYTPRFFKLIVDNITGPVLVCDQTNYAINPLTQTTVISWDISSKLDVVSSSSSHISVKPYSTVEYGHSEYIVAHIKTKYANIDEGQDVVIIIDTLRKEGLHVSNQPSNIQIHVPAEPIYGEVEAMVWASSYPGEESYNWQVSGGTIVSVTGSEMTLIADCPSRRGITISVKAINACGESSWIYKNVEVDCSGGINPLSILPNPADGYVDIIINQSQLMANQIGDEEKYEISIYNQSSLLIYKTKTYNSQLSINTQSFNEGIYYIILKYNDKMYNKQLIISR